MDPRRTPPEGLSDKESRTQVGARWGCMADRVAAPIVAGPWATDAAGRAGYISLAFRICQRRWLR